MIIDRRTANPIARLRPIPDTDRFELFYWSNVKGRWTTFGNLGRMKLTLVSAHKIVENDPMFRVPHSRWARLKLAKVKLRDIPRPTLAHEIALPLPIEIGMA
jgi:hypothetical protein